MLGLGKERWHIFEAYCRNLMISKSVKRKVELQSHKCAGMRGRKPRYEEIKTIMLGGCKNIQLSPDVVNSAKRNRNVLVHSTNPNNKPFFDFMYQDESNHFHAFQATIAQKHDAKVENIKQLETLVGGAQKLPSYFLVPGDIFHKFVTNPVNSSKEGGWSICHVMVPDPNASP